MPPHLALCCTLLAALAALWLGCQPALSAAAAPHWRAVLVAGDNAQPVFDNAVAALARWLGERGVPSADIHRLSARRPAGDPTVEPASAERILGRIASLRARPGEGCLVFITSHGQKGEGAWLAYSGEYLRPGALAQALAAGCAAVPTVVIVSSCYSGAFAVGAMPAANRVILTAAKANRPSFGCQADRTYTVFDECLLDALPRAPTWRNVSAASLDCVRRHEHELHVAPSQPQTSIGAAVSDLPVR